MRNGEAGFPPKDPTTLPTKDPLVFFYFSSFPHYSFFPTPGGPAAAKAAELPAPPPPNPPVASSDPEAGGAGLYLPFDAAADDEEAPPPPSHDAGMIFEIFLRILFSLTCCLCLSVAACFASGVGFEERWSRVRVRKSIFKILVLTTPLVASSRSEAPASLNCHSSPSLACTRAL